jgi:hypothetical protein
LGLIEKRIPQEITLKMLGRFTRYLERRWAFREHVARLRDNRKNSQVPTSSVFLTVFLAHAIRLGSFHGAEQQLRIPRRWERWVGERKPSADTLGYALGRMDLDPLRKWLGDLCQEAKRKKVFQRMYPDIHWIWAMDGIETYCSRKLHCPACLVREITVNGEKVHEYYHREVVLHLVGVKPAFPLDIESLLPGDTEVDAALRLIARWRKQAPRLFDLFTLDAFYLQAPFAKRVLNSGYGFQAVLKNETRDLYQDVEGLLRKGPAGEKISVGGRQAEVWDFRDLSTWPQLGSPVRVVRSLEKYEERHHAPRASREKWETIKKESDWRWAVILPNGENPPPDLTCHWGHARWNEESAFMDLTRYWHVDHSYHHHPVARLACLLILFLAFIYTAIFFSRNLKAALRAGMTRLHLARLLADDLAYSGLESFWAQPP